MNPLLFALASAGLVAGGPASAANIPVTNNSDSNPGSLRAAVNEANTNGDASNTITFSLSPGSTITLTTGQITVSKDLTLTGPGNNGITISGNNADRIFDIDPASADTELTVEGLTLRNGRVTGVGGCIRALPDEGYLASVTLNNSIVTGCTAEATGGANFTMDFVGGPLAQEGMGGGIFVTSYLLPDVPSLRLIDSTISGNTARVAGGGLLAYSVEALRSRISDNTVLGGQTSIEEGVPSQYILFFMGAGGGMLTGTAALTDSTVSGNTVNAVTFTEIPSEAPAPIDAIQFGNGGGLTVFSGLEARGSTIGENTVRSTASGGIPIIFGGGISLLGFNADGVSLLSDSTISGNDVNVSASTNSDYGIAFGGGLSAKYDMAIENSTIAGNHLLSGASQETAGFGSGMALKYLSESPSITLNSTIVGNNTATGSFVNKNAPYNSFGKLSDINLIDSNDTLTIVGANNLVTSVDSQITLPGDTLTSNPQLAPLANQGGVVSGAAGGSGTGPNQTMALYHGSPASNTGNNLSNLDYDQRGVGYPRVQGPAADIGAYEGSIERPITSIPTLGPFGIGLLSALLGMAGLAVQRLRRRSSGPN